MANGTAATVRDETPSGFRTPEGWRRVRQLFDGALHLEEPRRSDWLAECCGRDQRLLREVRSLLEAHGAAGTFIDRSALSGPRQEPELLGRYLGPYRIERLLGRGGMGTVYLASRADETFEKEVAVKVLNRGMDTDQIIHRFHKERQILADLEHPHVARLLDGGSTPDGRPYLVMERVDGRPIDRYCDEEGLGLEARIRLFLVAARAVSFAHRSLVVHRDLKPSNLLVDSSGQPKLLDFGIAKLLDSGDAAEGTSATLPGDTPLTPEYASPEQIWGGRITTASDVYSLGVVLYLLLTGQRAWAEGDPRHERVAALAQRQPVRPSRAVRETDPALARRLRGDLDAILLRALCDDPEHRYGSVDAFAEDLERTLEHRPVLARKGSWSYSLGRLFLRHKLGFTLAALGLTLLLGFLAMLLVQRDRILREQTRTREAYHFMTELFEAPDPFHGEGSGITVQDMLLAGARKLESHLAEEPQVRSDLQLTLGRSLLSLGQLEPARQLLESAHDLRVRLYRTEDPRLARSFRRLGELELQAGNYALAESHYRAAFEILERTPKDHHHDLVDSLQGLAVALDHLDRRPEAGESYRRALDLARSRGAGETPEGLVSLLVPLLEHYAGFLRRQDDFALARAAIEEALRIVEKTRGPEHAEVATLLNHLALLEKHQDPGRALERLEQAERIQRRELSAPHPHLALTLINQGRLHHETLRLREAKETFEEAIVLQRQIYPGPSPRLATALDLAAGVEADLGQIPSAIQKRREILALRQEMHGENHLESARSHNSLARLLVRTGAYDEAETHYLRSLDIVHEVLGPDHRHVGVVHQNLGQLAADRGDLESARSHLTRAAQILRGAVQPNSHLLATTLFHLAETERFLEQPTAEQNLEDALAIAHHRWTEQSPRSAEMEVVFCALLNDRGTFEKADACARHALDILTRSQAPLSNSEHAGRSVAIGQLQLGRSLLGLGHTAEARPWIRAAADSLAELSGAQRWAAEAERAQSQLPEEQKP